MGEHTLHSIQHRRSHSTTGAPSSGAWHCAQTAGRCATTASGAATRCSVSPRWPSCPPAFLPLRRRRLFVVRPSPSLEGGVVFSFLISSDSPQRAPRALIAEIGYAITPCDSGQDSGEVRRGEGKRDAARGRVRRKLTAWRAPACPAGQETNGGALVARLPGQPPVARIGAPPGAGLLLQPVHDRRECAWLLEQAFDGDPLERLSALPDADLVRLRVDLEHDGVPGQRLRHVLGRV